MQMTIAMRPTAAGSSMPRGSCPACRCVASIARRSSSFPTGPPRTRLRLRLLPPPCPRPRLPPLSPCPGRRPRTVGPLRDDTLSRSMLVPLPTRIVPPDEMLCRLEPDTLRWLDVSEASGTSSAGGRAAPPAELPDVPPPRRPGPGRGRVPQGRRARRAARLRPAAPERAGQMALRPDLHPGAVRPRRPDQPHPLLPQGRHRPGPGRAGAARGAPSSSPRPTSSSARSTRSSRRRRASSSTPRSSPRSARSRPAWPTRSTTRWPSP